MKKLLGLSLVASATILTLNASAKDLSEAIKNVDISGTVVYQYDDKDGQNGSIANTTNSYKMGVNLASKVNDDVTLNTRFLVGDNSSTGEAVLNTSTDADGNLNVKLSEVNFTYTGISNAAVIIGKQGLATPFTVDRDSLGAESTGTGILATYTIAPVTFAGAFFNQTNITNVGNGTQDVYAAAIIGSVGPINASAWYIDMVDIADAYTVALDASFELGAVTLEPFIRYADQDTDNSNNEVDTLKLGIGASVGIFDAFLGYGKTGKNGGVAIDGNSSDTTFDEHWNVALTNQADSDILFAAVGAQVTDQLHIALKYSSLDQPTGSNDEDETYAELTYEMSSNLTTYVRIGEYDVDTQESETVGRLNVEYSF